MDDIVAGRNIDGYVLIREIGTGGFGTVWLAHAQIQNGPVALKIITQQRGVASQRELKAVQLYKGKAVSSIANGLMPIEHVGLVEGLVFYVMPLADGYGAVDSRDSGWKPLALSARSKQHVENGTWFTSQEIVSLFADICKGAQTLSDARLVHRDIKPDNILFFSGRPVISDVSILTDDAYQEARFGTPGFSAPSWYVETGGKIDMYSIAATLFATLTGQPPDKMGLASFHWPPKGKESLSVAEQTEWIRLHQIVFRATSDERPERFNSFAIMAESIINNPTEIITLKDKNILTNVSIILGAVMAISLYGIYRELHETFTVARTPEDAWNKIMKAHRINDPIKAKAYETERGSEIDNWLYAHHWFDRKIDTLETTSFESEKQIFIGIKDISGGGHDVMTIQFRKEKAHESWKLDDVFLENMEGMKNGENLSQVIWEQAVERARLNDVHSKK